MPKTVTIYLGLGTNMGDRQANLRRALNLLSSRVKLTKLSPVYDTAPVGNTDQPRFLNMAVRGTTSLSPASLLAFVKSIEKQMGRKPGPPNSPRPIDIDILFYGDRTVNEPTLVVPHPGIAERAFVLAPLADITSGFRHPVNGKTVRRMLKEFPRSPGDAVKVEEQKGGFLSL